MIFDYQMLSEAWSKKITSCENVISFIAGNKCIWELSQIYSLTSNIQIGRYNSRTNPQGLEFLMVLVDQEGLVFLFYYLLLLSLSNLIRLQNSTQLIKKPWWDLFYVHISYLRWVFTLTVSIVSLSHCCIVVEKWHWLLLTLQWTQQKSKSKYYWHVHMIV